MAEVLVGKKTSNNLTVIGNKTQVWGLAGNDTLTSNGKSEVLLIGGTGNDVFQMTGSSGTLSGTITKALPTIIFGTFCGLAIVNAKPRD